MECHLFATRFYVRRPATSSKGRQSNGRVLWATACQAGTGLPGRETQGNTPCKIDDHTTIKQVTLKQGSAQQGVNLQDKIRQIGCCRLLSLALVLPGKYLLDVKMKIRCNWLDVFYEFCRAHLQIWKTLAGSLQAWLRQSFSTSWPIGRRWSHGYKHMMIHDDSNRLSTGNDTCYTAA